MTLTALISLLSIIAVVGIAVVGVVYRQGTKQGVHTKVLETALTTIGGLPAAFKELREEIDDHAQMYKSSLDLQNRKITILEAKWETTHKLVETVSRHDIEIAAIKAVCKERRGQSIKIHTRTIEEDEAGVAEELEPIGCPLDEGGDR